MKRLPLSLVLILLYTASFTQISNSDYLINIEGELDTELSGLNFDFLVSTSGTKCLLPTMHLLYDNVGIIPQTADAFSNSIQDCGNDLTCITITAFQFIGFQAGSAGPPLSGIADPTKPAYYNKTHQNILDFLVHETGFRFIGNSKVSWDQLPNKLQEQIIRSILTIHVSSNILKQFYIPILEGAGVDINNFDNESLYKLLFSPWTNPQLINFSSISALKKLDLRKLSFATRLCSEQAMRLKRNRFEILEFDSCIISTNYGKVGIYGNQDNRITGNHCLVLELGGNDTYTGNIVCSNPLKCPVSLFIDYSGNDYYSGKYGPVFSLLGISILMDVEGDDVYYSKGPGLSSALYGSSIIVDLVGTDIYQSESPFSLASAHAGISLLLDNQGDDQYSGNSYSMGYGGTMGLGLMVDNQGEDCYNCEVSDSQNKSSFTLGAARGRWAESTDAHSLGGGYGIFIDRNGNDRYCSGSFSQGASYFFGLGLFMDASGNDEYNAISHSQGYAAHMSSGCMIEYSGDDSYNPQVNSDKITQIIGGGRDNSAGLFIEMKGDDIYTFGNRSAGISDNYGTGLFWDIHGNDTLIWSLNSINSGSPSVGKTIAENGRMRFLHRIISVNNLSGNGIYVDRNGNNTIIKE